METLVLPVPLLRRLLRRVIDRPADRCFVTAGVRAASDGRDWLIRDLRDSPPSSGARHFEVHLTQTWPPLWLPAPEGTAVDRGAFRIALGTGANRGRFAAIVADRHRRIRMDRLTLVGPGMRTFDLRAAPETRAPVPAAASSAQSERDRWSRTIGALGEGAWRRLIDLRIVVVGAGRTGSVVATSLAALGVRQLTVVDPDVVELHNLGESDAMRVEDIGAPKALSVSRHVRRLSHYGGSVANALVASLWSPRGIEAAKRADVIFSCVDRDGPRLGAALIAAAHHRVLVDVGTGVLRRDPDVQPDERPPRMGADVRLILPGEGCLLCRGGLTDYDGAVRELAGAPTTSAAVRSGDGLHQRLGSLRSLNLLAAGSALRLFEGMVTGLGRGGWMHLEDDGGGRFEMTYPRPRNEPGFDAAPTCGLCLRAGLGDALI